MYFHQGTPYRYSAWQPIPYLGLPATPRPLYYGNLFMAQLLQGGHKQVGLLTNTTFFTSYGIYTFGKLTDVAIINFNIYNSTSTGPREYMRVDLPQASSKSVVRRLTAPGAEVKDGITFAGITVSAEGELSGGKLEKVEGNKQILVGASEAVLVTL